MSFYNSYNNLAPKHKTFISFHHADDYYKKCLETQWGESFEGFVSRSVGDGDINKNLPTDRIRQLIRDTKNNSRTGLLGVLLPNYLVELPNGMNASVLKYTENGTFYNPHTIPPRLSDNIECGFAKIYNWPTASNDLRQWIHDAFQRRKTCSPTNARDSFSNNRTESQTHWMD